MKTYFIEIWIGDARGPIETYENHEEVMKRIVVLTKSKEKFCLYIAECLIDES